MDSQSVAPVASIVVWLAARTISRLNYRWLCLIVLTLWWPWPMLSPGSSDSSYSLSTVVGLIASVAGIHKTHAMGVLMLPLIVRYIWQECEYSDT